MSDFRDIAGPPERTRWTDRTGERRLMLAALEDALRAALRVRPGRKHPRYESEALEWLTSGDDRHPFTYERICEALGLDPAWLRRRVFEARER